MTAAASGLIAITRRVSPTIGRCELTHLERADIDFERAQVQHREYEACLRELGCAVTSLEPEPAFPDSVFVEDVAVVLDEIAVLTRPGAPSRRGEVESVAAALRPHRTLRAIVEPGTLEGGDVLRSGNTLFVGRSRRTNVNGISQLAAIVAPFGYRVLPAEPRGCLHLKSAATRIAPGRILLNPTWCDRSVFEDEDVIKVDPREPHAANALEIAGAVMVAAAFPRTRERLEREGIATRPVEASELARAEGALTCCSLIFDGRDRTAAS